MTLEIPVEAPPLRVDETGTVRVGKTRVTLDLVLAAFNEGFGPEEIVLQFTTLSLADVYSAIGFYLHHKAEVDAYLAEGERQAEEIRAKIDANPDVRLIRERVMARYRALHSS